MDYQGTNTRCQKVWIAQKVAVITDEEEGFCDPPPNKILPTTSDNAQLEYAFYSLGKRVQARIADQKLECADICTLGDREGMEFSLRAQHLTFTQDITLYLLKCCKREVQLAMDWYTHVCFREMPVWIDTSKQCR